jgi:hypothetical protein
MNRFAIIASWMFGLAAPVVAQLPSPPSASDRLAAAETMAVLGEAQQDAAWMIRAAEMAASATMVTEEVGSGDKATRRCGLPEGALAPAALARRAAQFVGEESKAAAEYRAAAARFEAFRCSADRANGQVDAYVWPVRLAAHSQSQLPLNRPFLGEKDAHVWIMPASTHQKANWSVFVDGKQVCRDLQVRARCRFQPPSRYSKVVVTLANAGVDEFAARVIAQ